MQKRKFYQLSADERLETLVSQGVLTRGNAEELGRANHAGILEKDVASHLIENQISQYALPLAVVPGLVVNGATYTVPMVVEEASVVAAASNGARMAAACGGVTAHSCPSRVLGEVVYEAGTIDYERVSRMVVSRETQLFSIARKSLPSMHSRGGGLEHITVKRTEDGRFIKVLLTVNPCDAMGANAVNTIAEAISRTFESDEWFGQRPLVAILSNAGDESVSIAEVELEPHAIAVKDGSPQELAERIATLSDLAQSDYHRAVTHNKGIMNGISAAVVASGNDWRAAESCAHAYAGRGQSYKPLATWSVNSRGNLYGRIEIPLQVGLVGGAASSIPLARIARRMGGYDNVTEFKNVLAALGLVQNLSALRALAGPGIQAGHMNLQMNALAVAAGAKGDDIEQVASKLRQLPSSQRTLTRACEFVKELKETRS